MFSIFLYQSYNYYSLWHLKSSQILKARRLKNLNFYFLQEHTRAKLLLLYNKGFLLCAFNTSNAKFYIIIKMCMTAYSYLELVNLYQFYLYPLCLAHWSKTTLWSDMRCARISLQRCRLQRSSCAWAAQSGRHVNDEHRFTGIKSTLMRSSCLSVENCAWKFSLRRPSVSESLFAFKWQVSIAVCDVRGQTRFRSIIQPSAGLRNWLLCLGGRTNLQNLRRRVIRLGGPAGRRASDPQGCSVLWCLRTSVTWWNWLTPHYLQPCVLLMSVCLLWKWPSTSRQTPRSANHRRSASPALTIRTSLSALGCSATKAHGGACMHMCVLWRCK